MIAPEDESRALAEFERRKIMTLPQVMQMLDCSSRSAHRRLKQWKACCSYNGNGRFYTLPHIARYGTEGLWRHRKAFFSRHGNLRQTVVHLVKNSPQGFAASEIGEVLRLAPHSFISHFRNVPGIKREKLGKRFVYFCDEPDVYLRQKRARTEAVERELKLPPDADAVQILVDRIKHPNSSIQECARRLQRKGRGISCEAIAHLLGHHGIEKKTVDTR